LHPVADPHRPVEQQREPSDDVAQSVLGGEPDDDGRDALATATRRGLCSNELEAPRYFPPRRVALFSERIDADTEVL